MDPFQKYRNASVATVDPVGQLLFIFDEVLKLLFVAKKAIGEKDYENKYKALTKVTDVFYILRSGIDVQNGGELMKVLDSFYASTIYNVQKANMNYEEPEEMDTIINALTGVRDSIKQELDKQRN